MSKKRMLADVLWEAANVYLLPEQVWHPAKSYYTCDAALAASDSDAATDFLQELGCPGGFWCFENFEEGEQRQGVRYMWLLLAMHVAEDEGLTV
jgi:hypothetical protein